MTWVQKGFFVSLLMVILLLNLFSVRKKSLTYDEERIYQYGMKILELDSDRQYASPMPFSALNAIPRKLGRLLPQGELRELLIDIRTGRWVTILFSVLLACYLFKWAKELYGVRSAFFALILYTFSPNILAHSRLIHTDLMAAAVTTISLYYFWKFINTGKFRWGVVSASVVGLAQLVKYTSLLIYPVLVLILLARYSGELAETIRRKEYKAVMKYGWSSVKYASLFLVIGAVVINLGFLFNRTFTPTADYRFQSDLFKNIQTGLGNRAALPVPVPYPFLEGIDWGLGKAGTGEGFGYLYLLGSLKKGGNFKSYYLYVLLYKVPIAALILTLCAAVYYLFHLRLFSFRRNEAFLLIPIGFFFIFFSFYVTMQLGIRYIIIFFPLLYIFSSSVLINWRGFGLWAKITVVSLMAYLIISSLSYFPHYLSYFNELVGDRKNAYKILADSNLDWGQNEWYLEEYQKKHAAARLSPPFPVSGEVVVSANELVGIWNPNKYKWLRDNFQPVGHIAYSYLVFDIPPGADRSLYRDYETDLLSSPENYLNYDYLAGLAASRGDWEKARGLLVKCLELNPDYAVGYDHLGIIYASQGRGDEARAQWRRALDLDPDLASARKNLAAGEGLKELKVP